MLTVLSWALSSNCPHQHQVNLQCSHTFLINFDLTLTKFLFDSLVFCPLHCLFVLVFFNLARRMECVYEIHWIYLTHPSRKEPIESLHFGKGRQSWVANWTNLLSLSSRPLGFVAASLAIVVTAQGSLSVGGATFKRTLARESSCHWQRKAFSAVLCSSLNVKNHTLIFSSSEARSRFLYLLLRAASGNRLLASSPLKWLVVESTAVLKRTENAFGLVVAGCRLTDGWDVGAEC